MSATASTDEVRVSRDGALGRIVLDRPRAINALTQPMVTAVAGALRAWADDPSVVTVSIEGAGERGLCAGGDVVAVRRTWLAGGDRTAFFRAEYAMNALLATYPKPVVAFQDGVVMGGGVGVSAYTRLRLVTERSTVAMPETGIGLFPDVGALYLLARTPGEIGTHLALTGTPVDGPGAIAAGLADALIPAERWPDLLARLAHGAPVPTDLGDRTPSADLLAARSWIDECYAGNDAATILRRLREHDDPAAQHAGDILAGRSPLSVAVTLEALRRAATMRTVREVLDQDLVVAGNLVADGDFAEGVRAQLVDKDRKPTWQHTSLDDVSPSIVQKFFR
ncbi:enoyl-CoA hydratase/isomerase family protein [Luteipulveratus flavus]|uniref:3-hydroxyisobutyryl-CoA hydrolase n=1 Tax=Luteipulveratus flavus TaxID=3031728 RepID=A0ABT6CCM4_9MICO|nr:enoyl-CoA hydratase/isomerase family protein [Luteipulveratus sp. YIM 133296]MDF8266037.1 enoyl-CoA hydratase/isomerase family protein [Luteipulveratus sp. YIM 133296]